MNLGISATIGRFKPLHLGSALMLDFLCQNSEHAYIGLGSSNRELSVQNPFTAEESKEMITRFLHYRGYDNFTIFYVPDFAHLGEEYRDGKAWKENLEQKLESMGGIDTFVTANEWVENLLKGNYRIVKPVEFIPANYHVPVKGTGVRLEMALDENWKELVPKPVADYLEESGLEERFRKDFGEETIRLYSKNAWLHEDSIREQEKIYEGR